MSDKNPSHVNQQGSEGEAKSLGDDCEQENLNLERMNFDGKTSQTPFEDELKLFDASQYSFFGGLENEEELGGHSDDDEVLESGKTSEFPDGKPLQEGLENEHPGAVRSEEIEQLTKQIENLNGLPTTVEPVQTFRDANGLPQAAASFSPWLTAPPQQPFQESQTPLLAPQLPSSFPSHAQPPFTAAFHSQGPPNPQPPMGPASARIGSHHMNAFGSEFPAVRGHQGGLPGGGQSGMHQFAHPQPSGQSQMHARRPAPEEPVWATTESPSRPSFQHPGEGTGVHPQHMHPLYPHLHPPHIQPQYRQQQQQPQYFQQQQQRQHFQMQQQQQPQGLGGRGQYEHMMQRGGLLPAGMQSQYMAVEDLETVVRIQRASTQTSEPYVDDYYHQAMEAKRAAAAGLHSSARQFAPSQSREGRTAEGSVQAFLPVEGLGRIPFSSIRHPKPLLEVEQEADSGRVGQRLLQQEPMMAARLAIEDGNGLLLEVDDIDRRLSQVGGPQSQSGQQLLRKRRVMLQNLALSLQIVSSGQQQGSRGPGNVPVGSGSPEGVVFTRIVSLSKGRKLLARFLSLLPDGSDLLCFTAMTICRRLRFLFGGLHADSGVLAKAVMDSFAGMSLAQLTDCLSQVVVGEEKASFAAREDASTGQVPISMGLGGPEVCAVVRALLDQAKNALSHHGGNPQYRGHWQAAFDAFFVTLSRCLYMEVILNAMPLTPATASAVKEEMPMDVLKACVHHTTPEQRRLVLDVLFGLMHNNEGV